MTAAGVATIQVRVNQGTRRVTIRGPLAARDLRRLEQMCGPALEDREIRLEVRLLNVSEMDETSRLFITGLVRRGAALLT